MKIILSVFASLVMLTPFAHAQDKSAPHGDQVTESPAAEPAPTPEQQVALTEGHHSRWRLLGNLGLGSLAPRSRNEASSLERDFRTGGALNLGVMAAYRPGFRWGYNFGLKLFALARPVKSSDLSLVLTYLGVPFEVDYRFARVGKHSGFHVKAGLTYLVLLSADVDKSSNSENSNDDDDDWDWDDAFPSPPTKGSYRGSFAKSDVLASLGVGGDFMLFQARNGFNMTLIPEFSIYRGLTTIGKSREFGGDVRNRGWLLNVALGFGF